MSHISLLQRKDMKYKNIYKINKEFANLAIFSVTIYPIQTIYKRYRKSEG